MEKMIILGGGESGVGTAILAKQKGYEVFVSDKGIIKSEYKKKLEEHQIEFESGEHTIEKILNADLVMKSPGIPDKVPLVVQLLEKGIPVMSEIEFAAKYTDATLIGITGSNGKTTTTMLLHHILKKAGFNTGMAGNIGDSFALQVATKNFDSYVLELSSFQLDGIKDFKPHIAIITNITPDHLDRYEYKFENYIASKFLITKNQTENDYLIYDADNKEITTWLETNTTRAQLVPFSLEEEVDFGAQIVENKIQTKLNKEVLKMDISKLAIKGKHNTKNAMASSLAAQMMRARKQVIKESLEDFEGAEHRLEKVLKINGVQYINDSKATNVNATFYALECMEAPTVWIVGGVDKGNDYLDLMPLVREKVKAIICLGVDNSKIIHAFDDVVDLLVETSSADEAVKIAYKLASKGENVLLSPACASFDLFESYEDRGRQFKNAVRHL
ncbi:UDP-N-acetylmuramoyl-L-alanine--D-glutamate ligase [Flavicella marina]|uniref:UDP-N-acetylmuramoyl-L-alanine--D-glutamate ligase n=1 Tax=Flavicella marina TaxID=1475951 RepID=UPI0012641D9E|nr:UDP-N-acetylmuramoyl-L-alanine--D-glutamate ligase [Flavicella marina]